MKKLMKNNIFRFIIGMLLCSGIVYGINLYKADDILYTTSDGIVTNVNDAINSLYNMKKELNDLKNTGDATAEDIASGKTAVVQGELVTGTFNSNAIKKTLVWTGSIDPTHTSATTNEYIYLNNSYADYQNITAANIGVEQTDIAVVATAFGGCSTSWNYTPSSGLITLTVTGRKGFPNCGKQSYNVYVYTAS